MTETKMPARTNQIKASQIRGVPWRPVQNLHPCYMTDGLNWNIDSGFQLSAGIMVTMDGVVSYAPSMIPKMNISEVRVFTHVDAFDEDARYSLKLTYLDKDEKVNQRYTDTINPVDKDRFVFNIPVEHIESDNWFICSLELKLLSPMSGEYKEAAENYGMEAPNHPVLLRGAWLEIKG